MYQVNSEILAVWKKHENIDAPFMKRIPLFYTKPKTNCLLYVGFNPSFNEIFADQPKSLILLESRSFCFIPSGLDKSFSIFPANSITSLIFSPNAPIDISKPVPTFK